MNIHEIVSYARSRVSAAHTSNTENNIKSWNLIINHRDYLRLRTARNSRRPSLCIWSEYFSFPRSTGAHRF